MLNFTNDDSNDIQLKCISKINEIKEDLKTFFEYKRKMIELLSRKLNKMDIYLENDSKKLPESTMDKIFNRLYYRNKEIKIMNDGEKEEMIDKILNQYRTLTGISVERIDNRTMKIDFNLTEKNKGYYIILYFENESFSVKKIFPEEIKFEKYLNDNNMKSIQNLTLFLVKLINYEFIPLLNE